jgi:hypothetical protein
MIFSSLHFWLVHGFHLPMTGVLKSHDGRRIRPSSSLPGYRKAAVKELNAHFFNKTQTQDLARGRKVAEPYQLRNKEGLSQEFGDLSRGMRQDRSQKHAQLSGSLVPRETTTRKKGIRIFKEGGSDHFNSSGTGDGSKVVFKSQEKNKGRAAIMLEPGGKRCFRSSKTDVCHMVARSKSRSSTTFRDCTSKASYTKPDRSDYADRNGRLKVHMQHTGSLEGGGAFLKTGARRPKTYRHPERRRIGNEQINNCTNVGSLVYQDHSFVGRKRVSTERQDRATYRSNCTERSTGREAEITLLCEDLSKGRWETTRSLPMSARTTEKPALGRDCRELEPAIVDSSPMPGAQSQRLVARAWQAPTVLARTERLGVRASSKSVVAAEVKTGRGEARERQRQQLKEARRGSAATRRAQKLTW